MGDNNVSLNLHCHWSLASLNEIFAWLVLKNN